MNVRSYGKVLEATMKPSDVVRIVVGGINVEYAEASNSGTYLSGRSRGNIGTSTYTKR
jgi:hypothetical protein